METIASRTVASLHHFHATVSQYCSVPHCQQAVVQIVREKYLNKTKFSSKAELHSFLSELYVFLTDQVPLPSSILPPSPSLPPFIHPSFSLPPSIHPYLLLSPFLCPHFLHPPPPPILLYQVHVGLSKVLPLDDPSPPLPSPLDCDKLRQFALEAESYGDLKLAERYYQEVRRLCYMSSVLMVR